MRRDAAWWGAVIVSMLTAGFLPAAAGAWASERIGRNATGVRLQADASGRVPSRSARARGEAVIDC